MRWIESSQREQLSEFSTRIVASFHELHPAVPREYYRAVVALNYCYLLCLVIHVLLIPLFLALGETLLAVFNAGSVGVFAACLHLNAVRGNFRLPVIFGTAEILVHATLCVLIFGWAGGFHYYIVALGISTFIIPWWTVARKLQVVAGVGLLMVALNLYGRSVPPASLYDTTTLGWLHLVNLLILVASLGLIGFAVSLSAARAEETLNIERGRSERLLHNILPAAIAERLKESADIVADRFEETTILFSDLVGFTSMSEGIPAEDLVGLLNDVFIRFDELVRDAGVEKIKTIGDGYMVASGLPGPQEDHVERICDLALSMREAVAGLRARDGQPLGLRIGIHTGPVVAGVIGYTKFAYDVWGDTVNTASRMESHGMAGRIHVSEAVYRKVRDRYRFQRRGTIEVKGKGSMSTWFLEDRV